MKYGNIIISKDEYELIHSLIQKQVGSQSLSPDEWCLKLHSELKNAIIKDEDEMPDDVIRLNSIVDVETPFGVKQGLVVVKPMDRNIELNKISFLSPMGSALLGYARKDEVEWSLPRGKSVIKILNVKNQ